MDKKEVHFHTAANDNLDRYSLSDGSQIESKDIEKVYKVSRLHKRFKTIGVQILYFQETLQREDLASRQSKTIIEEMNRASWVS